MTYQNEQELLRLIKTLTETTDELARYIFEIREDLKQIKEREVSA